jgi:hypothetical protein
MHWVIKELKIKPGRNLRERLMALVKTVTLSPELTWVYKVKKFSHNYIYRNARRSLAEHYRSVTK